VLGDKYSTHQKVLVALSTIRDNFSTSGSDVVALLPYIELWMNFPRTNSLAKTTAEQVRKLLAVPVSPLIDAGMNFTTTS
jgi:hypothetical protein